MTRRMIAAAIALPLLIGIGPALAAGPGKGGHISVTGEGTVSAAPDIATINVGVITTAPEAKAAVEANSAASAKLHETLAANGIAAADIQTARFSVYPQYENVEGRQQPEISGYTVENTVQVTVRKLDTLGQTLDLAIQAGANRVDSIVFGLADPAAATDAARHEALKDARRKAELYAADAGVTLGRLLSIKEHGAERPRPVTVGTMRAAQAAVPIAPGEQEVGVTISVSYAIAGAAE
ncbi:MAG: SIMPL domain-containing protein [Alphaproteobacteria bacterium]